MSIFKKLFTAVRGGATEVGEAIVDSQAIRILEQELRDSKIALNDAKTNLTAIMAEKMGVDRRVKDLAEKIKELWIKAMKVWRLKWPIRLLSLNMNSLFNKVFVTAMPLKSPP